jgi:paraquat-inducible protein B
MSYSPISVETADNPNTVEDVEFVIQMPENNTDMEELKAKMDEVINTVNEVDLSLSTQIQDVEIGLNGLNQEILKLKKYLTNLIKEEISLLIDHPPRRLVAAKQPRIPESVVDLRSDDDEPTIKRSKLEKYTEK